MQTSEPSHQYGTPFKLSKRADFNTRFATKSWFGWIAQQVPPLTGQVLDIGCGPGWFWKSIAGTWKPDHLTLCDQSQGMIKAAQARLEGDFAISTVRADAMDLPFADDQFDGVLAMHMLYHVADPGRALDEFTRVTRPGGRIVVTTINEADLKVMSDLSREVFGSSGADLILPVFGARRAAELIANRFDRFAMHSFRDQFAVDETEAAVDYITSFPPGDDATQDQITTFRARFEQMREAGGGVVEMDRLQDLFDITLDG